MLEARNVHKSYLQSGGDLHVLKGIDLTVEAGEIMVIVGPSGAGKSTLLHVLSGLDRPDQGTVRLENEEIFLLKEPRLAGIRNTRIGFVFQFYHLLPEFTALENVMLPGIINRKKSSLDDVRTQAADLLDKVGLGDRAGHRPFQLSGGEQQRVAVARALVNRPKIVFCDEPTGNLDSKSGETIIALLKGLNRENGQTMVIVSHDESLARSAHSIRHIKDGKIIH